MAKKPQPKRTPWTVTECARAMRRRIRRQQRYNQEQARRERRR
jgi:hypothetical protein